MPVWFYIGASPELNRLNNSAASKCLRPTHSVETVGDLMNFASRIDPSRPHLRRIDCACRVCKSDRNLGCAKPYR
ncbi:hypothetical protein B0H14DRAFT_2303195, partial [Mycena olivaceomarginata]